MTQLEEREERRLALLAQLTAGRSRLERNRLGQFATPPSLAKALVEASLPYLEDSIHYLEPGFGTGAFFSALVGRLEEKRLKSALGLELDPTYGEPARALYGDTLLTLRLEDFTKARPEPRFNLILCNPPYVRHHHLEAQGKRWLLKRCQAITQAKFSGLSGLYCYFMVLASEWLEEGGLAAFLVPGEFMEVNYGAPLRRFLLERVELLRVHRFRREDVQFADALVSSAVVWYRKRVPMARRAVVFSEGGSLDAPLQTRDIPLQALVDAPRWTGLSESLADSPCVGAPMSRFFHVKRGLATGDNRFFILLEEEIARRGLSWEFFRPILPGPRHLKVDEVMADGSGLPMIDPRRFLLDIPCLEQELKDRAPLIWAYLQEGVAAGVSERYLCRHRRPWYAQEARAPAPLVCTYLGREGRAGRPFRFILNHSSATLPNVYLALYPTLELAQALAGDGALLREVWRALNSVAPERYLRGGRGYGGGLYKLEPRELMRVEVPEVAELVRISLERGESTAE